MPLDQKNPNPFDTAKDWRVDIKENGRCGSVSYQESAGCISFRWEFGGGDTVAIIYFEDETAWRTKHPWVAGRRTEILQRVADEVIRQKAHSCRAEMDERAGWIVSGSLKGFPKRCRPSPLKHLATPRTFPSIPTCKIS